MPSLAFFSFAAVFLQKLGVLLLPEVENFSPETTTTYKSVT